MKNPTTLKIKTLKHYGKWCDNDMVMLYACFTLLADCVENENLLDGFIDWTATEESWNIKKEFEALYSWWNERKELDVTDVMKTADISATKNEGVIARTVNEDEQYEEDNEMLMRLIKIRKHLWT